MHKTEISLGDKGDDVIVQLVRDLCKVGGIPKSEAKRRILKFAQSVKEETVQEFLNMERCYTCGEKFKGGARGLTNTCPKCWEEE